MRNRWNMRGVGLALALLTVGLGACNDESDLKPTRADITITGESEVPLRLVVSTDFVETINDATAERGAIFNTADTTTINTLPYTDVVLLTDQGSIVVDVANPSDTPATVRLQVNLDTGQSPYDRTAVMSEGGALRFVFSFFSPTFGSP